MKFEDIKDLEGYRKFLKKLSYHWNSRRYSNIESTNKFLRSRQPIQEVVRPYGLWFHIGRCDMLMKGMKASLDASDIDSGDSSKYEQG
jgi:hypothetical protein